MLKQGHNVLPEAKRTMKLLTGEDGRLPKYVIQLLPKMIIAQSYLSQTNTLFADNQRRWSS